MASDPVVIASYARTPMGGFQGALASLKATDLGAAAVKAALQRAGVWGEVVDRIYMGCVLPAGLGQAPARQAALAAGLPRAVEASTLNKMCGSGMQAAIMACDALAAGAADVIVAGGMESMTNAPCLDPAREAERKRWGLRARSSDRRFGRTYPGDAARGAETPRRAARGGRNLHRRRSHGHGAGADLT